MGSYNTYHEWLNSIYIDADTKVELQSIHHNDAEIEDRFRCDLAFGTGGLRGIIGSGTNRMNVYTVQKATQGLSAFILKAQGSGIRDLSSVKDDAKAESQVDKNSGSTIPNSLTQIPDARYQATATAVPAVAIAYDSRHMSAEFAMEAALVLAGNGIRTYLYDSLRSTPQLSYTVRSLQCQAGIVITASHNPAEYNGYKVYGADGCQITEEAASMIEQEIANVTQWHQVKMMHKNGAIDTTMITYVGQHMDNLYIEKVKSLAKFEGSDLKLVYTPLHGTGLMPVTRCLKELGYTGLKIVYEQSEADGAFRTVKSPNPEDPAAFEMVIELAQNLGAKIVFATDPDCDRIGVAEDVGSGDFKLLTGNQMGALLIDFMLTSGRVIPENSAIIKTIVTSELGAEIARAHGITVFETLTGFKYIGELIGEWDKSKDYQFLLGYEESYGYLAGDFVRDKDAVIASVLIAEMASWHYGAGRTLHDRLAEIYAIHGTYAEGLDAITKKGASGLEEIKRIMADFRNLEKVNEAFSDLVSCEDYLMGIKTTIAVDKTEALVLPKSDVLKFRLKDNSWFAVRPSGTEPKIKFYYSVTADSNEVAELRLNKLREQVFSMI